jgi:molecular chaperone DnaK (HSP70)
MTMADKKRIFKIGIDLGTTNTVVALADRGNYPILELSQSSDPQPRIPTLLAYRGDELEVGWEALEVWHQPGWELLGSPKRWLGVPEPEILPGEDAGQRLESLMTSFLKKLKEKILQCPHVEGADELQVLLGVPANANSLQRQRTLQAARNAGFQVLGLLHEPTAAAIEYAHRHPGFGKQKELRHILVYDLGGGTFDVALIRVEPQKFTVLCSAGVERLGGDDFDEKMADLALDKAKKTWDDLSYSDHYRLLMRCREAKEALQGTTRKWILSLDDIGLGEISLYREEYLERCLPLVDKTVKLVEDVLKKGNIDLEEIDALLLVGGGSQMPLVRKRLKEVVSSRLRVSPHPFASTAIGLSIYAEHMANTAIEEKFSRHFGVWREAERGTKKIFDPIFARETNLPKNNEHLQVIRRYQPAHNIGHFQFEECSTLDENELPTDSRTPWCKILFPFDAALPSNDRLEHRKVERYEAPRDFWVEEKYDCDSRGLITVTLTRSEPLLVRSFFLHGPEKVELPT